MQPRGRSREPRYVNSSMPHGLATLLVSPRIVDVQAADCPQAPLAISWSSSLADRKDAQLREFLEKPPQNLHRAKRRRGASAPPKASLTIPTEASAERQLPQDLALPVNTPPVATPPPASPITQVDSLAASPVSLRWIGPPAEEFSRVAALETSHSGDVPQQAGAAKGERGDSSGSERTLPRAPGSSATSLCDTTLCEGVEVVTTDRSALQKPESGENAEAELSSTSQHFMCLPDQQHVASDAEKRGCSEACPPRSVEQSVQSQMPKTALASLSSALQELGKEVQEVSEQLAAQEKEQPQAQKEVEEANGTQAEEGGQAAQDFPLQQELLVTHPSSSSTSISAKSGTAHANDGKGLFEWLDQDGDGVLGRDEARVWFRSLGWCLSDSALDSILDQAYTGNATPPTTWRLNELMAAADLHTDICGPDPEAVRRSLLVLSGFRHSTSHSQLSGRAQHDAEGCLSELELEHLLELCGAPLGTKNVEVDSLANSIIETICQPKALPFRAMSSGTGSAHGSPAPPAGRSSQPARGSRPVASRGSFRAAVTAGRGRGRTR